jgi:alpha-tubulin suppressor-like RCC1 family protein
MSTYQPDTNFIGKDGEDLGKVLVTKDYLLSVYPQLSQELLGITPELWTWGLGSYGQLGDNTIISRSTPVTTFAGGTNWKQVSSGGYHCAAIKTDGTLWTWGRGTSGQLGTNNTTSISTPVTTFAGGTNWKQVSAGSIHTAAIKTDGTLWTWGAGTEGRLGTNNTSQRNTPVTTFVGGTNWKQVSTTGTTGIFDGGAHCAAIKTDGTLWTWGRNYDGQLGINNTTDKSTPVTTFAGGTNWKQVSCGFAHIAAIKTDGTLWTWGENDQGRLGDLDNKGNVNIETPVTTFAGGTNWKQVSSGGEHTTAIKTDGTLWTWGNGSNGELGTNNTSNRNSPVTTFAGGTNWKQVSAGSIHTAAIKTDGTLWTWGNGGLGRLGTNDTSQRNTPVTTFAGGTNWKQVSSGREHTATIQSQDII